MSNYPMNRKFVGGKLTPENWADIYDAYQRGEKLSAIQESRSEYMVAHPRPSSFRQAFDNYCGREKLPGRLGRGE